MTTRTQADRTPDAMLASVWSARTMAVVRIAVGVLWLTNVNWKMPPTFGEGGGGLYGYTRHAVDNPVFQPFSWLVEHLVLPNFVAFGWTVLLMESLLGAFLLLGLATRLWAAIGVVQSVAITLSVAQTPPEWPWSYYLMIAANLSVWATAAGRSWGLDALARPVWSLRHSWTSRLLLRSS